MSYPILKANSTWFTPTLTTTKRNLITAINIVDSYTPSDTVTDSWDASEAQDGSIMVYLDGTVITIAGNGSGGIKANEDASWMFSDTSDIDFFNSCTAINGLEILDTSNTTNMQSMFYRCNGLTSVDVSTFDTSNVVNMSYMFAVETNGTAALTSITFGNNFVKSTVTDISFMLYGCRNLIALNIDDWDVSNVVDMRSFAKYCDNLTTFGANNLANWNLGNVVYMDEAFRNLLVMKTLAVENWDVSKVKSMYALFCANAKMFPNGLDLRNWDVGSCKYLDFVFWGCTAMKTLNCENWNVGNVETFDHFAARSKLTSFNHSGWNVGRNCKNLNALFHSYQGTEIDIRGWDTSNVEVFCQMFDGCSKLLRVHGLNELDTSNGRDFTQMFWSTTQLEEMDLSKFDTRHAVDDYLLGHNGTIGDGLSGIFAGGVHKNLKKLVLSNKFSFYGDGSLTDACSAVLPTTTSGYYYDIGGNQYTKDDIKAMENPAGTYYATFELAKEAMDSKKYISLTSMRVYHDMQNANIDTKLNTLKEELGNIEEISSEEIQALFNVSV